MNWLAHFWLADATGSSLCGQFLGDWVKGRDLSCFDPAIANGIRLHRTIDRLADEQPEYCQLKQHFSRSTRRYASILLDIGFDYSLARQWSQYGHQTLAAYTASAEARLIESWPSDAPFQAEQLKGLAGMLASYDSQEGVKRALAGIERRLSRPAALVDAFSEIETLAATLDLCLHPLLSRMQTQVAAEHRRLGAAVA
ncbi:DUF479 domain-containing protein [Salinisphaera sp. USBA-960]|uniref:acyl carrier protein phosphodiesterase n=1 Tax=Salinisphaera orenii TaxID=856731 RepID=UPI000DBE9701|nr:DUF479 domain-containing protein [Salifodinibacter halophilus]NNC26119.1 DUF479 domain-containing protein [Salifodinibacter halophilus]